MPVVRGWSGLARRKFVSRVGMSTVAQDRDERGPGVRCGKRKGPRRAQRAGKKKATRAVPLGVTSGPNPRYASTIGALLEGRAPTLERRSRALFCTGYRADQGGKRVSLSHLS